MSRASECRAYLLKEPIVGRCWVTMVVGGGLLLGLTSCLHLRRHCGVIQRKHSVQDVSYSLSCTHTGRSPDAKAERPHIRDTAPT